MHSIAHWKLNYNYDYLFVKYVSSTYVFGVETIPVLLSTMKEEFYSYKNGALVFTQKAPLLFIYLNL